MRILIAVIGLILALTCAGAGEEARKIYKTTDEYGRPLFTDQGSEDAEEVEVSEPMTFPADRFAEDYERFTSQAGKEDQARAALYNELAVTYPENNATIRSNPGNFEVRFRANPGPRTGHTLQLLVDGTVYRNVTSSGSLQLTNVDRGSHTLQLQVIDSTGEIVQQGPPVTMHLLRHSILHPQGRKSGN